MPSNDAQAMKHPWNTPQKVESCLPTPPKPWNTHGTPMEHPQKGRIMPSHASQAMEHPWNTHETPLEHPWNTHGTPPKRSNHAFPRLPSHGTPMEHPPKGRIMPSPASQAMEHPWDTHGTPPKRSNHAFPRLPSHGTPMEHPWNTPPKGLIMPSH